MIRNNFFKVIKWQQSAIQIRLQSTGLNIEKLEQESIEADSVIDDDQKLKEEMLEKKRNKSRLNAAHRNILFDKKPYSEPVYWSHKTIKYNRQMYGKYGESSGVNPAICWPTKKELKDKLEYEQVAYPHAIQEMIETVKKVRQVKNDEMRLRDEQIIEKMTKLDGWVKDMKQRLAKKEAEVLAAKEQKDKLIEEVRRHFGYTVDPRDDKFKEMLEKKEKEQKKKMKEARKKAKEEKLIQKLIESKPTEANAESKKLTPSEGNEEKQN